MNPSKPRVRFAPSPTGYLHVGGVRTLLFNLLFAKKQGATLLLRIDDTDKERSTAENERMLLEDIRALGVTFDEGEGVGGLYAPYRQSDRMEIYTQSAKKLLDEGKVYYCFCSPEMITQKREAALKLGKTPHYDGTCAKLSRADAEKKLADGEKAGLRFRALEKDIIVHDLVHGEVVFRQGTVGDFLITRTPTPEEKKRYGGIGMPVYNFCSIIDDHLMKISHIIRGEDHLSNTARQIMILEALGGEMPQFAHLPMVLGADRQKLSKRMGDVSAHEYLTKGYVPEAILNFLALLGWWPPQGTQTRSGHPEVLLLDEMISVFSMDGLQKHAAVFDLQKLKWMNSYYLRFLPLDEIVTRALPYFEQSDVPGAKESVKLRPWLSQVIEVIRGEAELLSDLPQSARFFLSAKPTVEEDARALLKDPDSVKVVQSLKTLVGTEAKNFTLDEVQELPKSVQAQTGMKGKKLFLPIRAAITGSLKGPELVKLLPLLTRAAVSERINHVAREVGV